MVQESGSDAFCIAEKLKPRSAIKGTLRGVRGGVKSPYSIFGPDFPGLPVDFLFLEKLMQIDCGMLDDVLEFFSERLEHASQIHCERSRLCTR